MKWFALAAVIALVVLVVWYWHVRGNDAAHAARGSSATQAGESSAPPMSETRRDRPPAHVVKLSPEERKHVADRIAAAHAAHAAHPTTPRPELATPETMS